MRCENRLFWSCLTHCYRVWLSQPRLERGSNVRTVLRPINMAGKYHTISSRIRSDLHTSTDLEVSPSLLGLTEYNSNRTVGRGSRHFTDTNDRPSPRRSVCSYSVHSQKYNAGRVPLLYPSLRDAGCRHQNRAQHQYDGPYCDGDVEYESVALWIYMRST